MSNKIPHNRNEGISILESKKLNNATKSALEWC